MPPFHDLPPLLLLNVVANGVTGPDFPVQILESYPRVLLSCDFGPPASSSNCYPLVTHADGSIVSASSPTGVGETITLWAVGLGLDEANFPPTGSGPSAAIRMVAPDGEVSFGYNYPLPSGPMLPGGIPADSAASQSTVLPAWVGLSPGYVGLYQINVSVPPAPAQSYPACGSAGNAAVTFVAPPQASVGLCVQP
jgi:hypothetical protein